MKKIIIVGSKSKKNTLYDIFKTQDLVIDLENKDCINECGNRESQIIIVTSKYQTLPHSLKIVPNLEIDDFPEMEAHSNFIHPSKKQLEKMRKCR